MESRKFFDFKYIGAIVADLHRRIFKELYGNLRSPSILRFYWATETDKGCVASVEPSLSGELTDLIRAKLGDARASSFASKIKVVYEKGLIPENIYHDLELIRKIRNRIVHKEGMIDFDDKEIRELCGKFKNASDVGNDDPRKVFCSVANNILALLMFARSPAHKLDACSAIKVAQEGVQMFLKSQNGRNLEK